MTATAPDVAGSPQPGFDRTYQENMRSPERALSDATPRETTCMAVPTKRGHC